MRLIIAVVVILILGSIAVWARSSKKDEPEDYGIQFCITLSDYADLDSDRLAKDFQTQWKTRIACEENPEWADPKKRVRCYVATEGNHAVMITTRGEPIPRNLLDTTAESAIDLSKEQKTALMNHKACITVEYVAGSKNAKATDRISFTAKLVISLLKLCPATGYVNVSAQSYRAKDKVKPFLDLTKLEPTPLFLMATTIHRTTMDDDSRWLHTHGMEQFGLPDLEAKYSEKGKDAYYEDLIGNTALYLMDKGPVMKPGHTAELAGDGVIYQIRSPSGESKKHFGKYGALEIARK